MVTQHGTGDIDRDLQAYNIPTMALAAVLGCASLCLALVAIACAVYALVAWL